MIRFPIIKLHNISLHLPDKQCFEAFSQAIYYGERIAIMGMNGSGKSTLLKIIRKEIEPSSGLVEYSGHPSIGYVGQIINEYDSLSGAQRFNKALSQALSTLPDVLLLDEPTNHLDADNKKSLIKMLENYRGALIIVSHETSLLSLVDKVWHIKDGKIYNFSCSYKDYLNNLAAERSMLINQLTRYEKEKRSAHDKLMFEQERAKKRKIYGQKKYQRDTIALQGKKRQGEVTTAKRKQEIIDNRSNVIERIRVLNIPEEINYKFSLDSVGVAQNQSLISINNGICGYENKVILENINLNILGREKVALLGKNGSGKTTLFNVLCGHKNISVSGKWAFPSVNHIGYLDQHYCVLNDKLSVFQQIKNIRFDWEDRRIRDHLNSFLFRKNAEIAKKISYLSGGERVRLVLAIIAAKPPRILYLDEPTNNLDIESKEHLISVLKAYPGAVFVISHDEEFLEKIAINIAYKIENKKIFKVI
ncbi:MAG: ABC-F family ATP-binding cassette domain-containing protein [Rickettsiales bacterium]|nr:ABC-F family ATP-binding cassette domain-containing protein [Rickettsiales bacterium]